MVSAARFHRRPLPWRSESVARLQSPCALKPALAGEPPITSEVVAGWLGPADTGVGRLAQDNRRSQ
jgi:hypothetical protein